MNATARKPAGHLNETIEFLAGPEGTNAMPTPRTNPGASRYTFTSGSRPLDGYTIKRAIGRGGFGEVYYATSDAGKEVALKLITRNVEVERRGVAQCMNLKCQNLLSILDLRTNDSGETFVIMEYVSGPSLATVLAQHPNGMPEPEIRAWLKGIIEGVEYLHDHGVVHRDLKPANMFIEEGVVKIGDYGLAKMISPEKGSNHSESIGTCHYMAPEISTGRYSKAVDIYAIGVMLYEMITGRVPFEGESVGEVLMKHLTSRPDLTPIPAPYRAIVEKALAKDPNLRQKRTLDLLPSGDAPRRDVRFIGEGKNAPPVSPAPLLSPAPRTPKGPDDDILRIGEEEPVFYIGPNTLPPEQPRRKGGSWFWLPGRDRRNLAAAPNPQGRNARPPVRRAVFTPPPPPQRPTPLPRPAKAPKPLPPAPTPPPPLAVGRVRLAQATGSMIAAAPLSGLLSVLIATMTGMDYLRRPQELAFLFAVSLLGSWGLIAGNLWAESKPIDGMSKRFGYLGWGLVVGLAAQILAEFTNLKLSTDHRAYEFTLQLGRSSTLVAIPHLLGIVSFFGLSYFANGWWKMTERDRKRRFRFWPVIASGVIAAGLGLFWPGLNPVVVWTVPLSAVVVQLVSPWSDQAARYVKFFGKDPAKVA